MRVEDQASLETQLADIGCLDEPTRRALYLYVATRPDAVSRDEAASALGLSRSLAVFHLDRLAQAGLLDVEFRRLTGRTGPGAGRPAKLYRRSTRQLDLTLPPRRYALAAELLLSALVRHDSPEVRRTLVEVARTRGSEVADEALAAAGSSVSRARRKGMLQNLLVDNGYEPYVKARRVRLSNCPFHPLAPEHPELVCEMNCAFVEGLTERLGVGEASAVDPAPGECCVVLKT